MADPGSITAGLGASMSGALPQLMIWLGYGLMIFVIIGIFFAVYMFIQFKYPVTVMVRGGRGTDDEWSIGRIVRDRGRIIKEKGVSKLHLLKLRKKIEPPQLEDVYPNNSIFLYQIDEETFLPMGLETDGETFDFKPIPRDIRYWQSLEYQKIDEDYAKHDFWNDNKSLITAAIVGGLCLAAVVATIYFTYQFAGGHIGATKDLAGAIRNAGVITGMPPG